jgi:hypothetical protein
VLLELVLVDLAAQEAVEAEPLLETLQALLLVALAVSFYITNS